MEDQNNKIVSINKGQDDTSELKDMMSGNILQGLLGNGIEEKIPAILEKFAPNAYDGIVKHMGQDAIRYIFYNDPEFGLVIQKLDMSKESTVISFEDPTKEDIIIIQKTQEGLSMIRNGERSNIASLLKTLMSSIGGKLF